MTKSSEKPSRTDRGNKYNSVKMDYFSKWVEVYALLNQEVATVAEAFVRNAICCIVIPLEIHSDKDRYLDSALFQNICKTLMVQNDTLVPAFKRKGRENEPLIDI